MVRDKKLIGIETKRPPFNVTRFQIDRKLNPQPAQDVEEMENKAMLIYIRKEADTKFRCTECQKLFRGDDFCRKHIRTKHPHLIEHVQGEVDFFNSFCERYLFEPKSFGGSSKGPSGSGRSSFGRSRDSHGPSRRYNDLDAIKQNSIVLDYD